MNYDIFLAGDGGHIPDLFLGTIRRDPQFKPTLHGQISIKGKVFEVIRQEPAANPPPSDSTKISFFVEPLNLNKPYRRKNKF